MIIAKAWRENATCILRESGWRQADADKCNEGKENGSKSMFHISNTAVGPTWFGG